MNQAKNPPAGMRAVTKKNALPIYGIGLVWLIWALLFPLYRVEQFLCCAVLSLAVFLLLKKLLPDIVTYEKIPEVHTGEEEADALLHSGSDALSAISRAQGEISNETVRAKIERLKSTCGRILAYVQEHPKSAGGLRKFMNYYLPTLQKLVDTYALMEKQGVEGENISSSKARIEEMLDTMDLAFEKQLDALFGDTALDIDTDITVMQNMMAGEGLTKPEASAPAGVGDIPDPLGYQQVNQKPHEPPEDGGISLHF